jgi:arylsulfatase A-like enzyme
MNRRTFIQNLTGVAGVSPLAAQQESRASKPPNILFILFDKCRTDAFGAYGEKDVHTPNIDFLAETGVRFNHCYTPQALCGPARASIITGAFPHAHGLRKNPYPKAPSPNNCNYQESIPDPFRDTRFKLWPNFPYLLNNAGYATAHIGKWHLGPANPGFYDYWKSFNSGLQHWIGEPYESEYRPDVHTSQGIRFIERHADEPFFLYQSYYAPHERHDPPKEFLTHYEGDEHAGYYGSVSNLDWNVGRLLDALRDNNILDETLIIVTTEHGMTRIARAGTTVGMCIPYDEAARIPLIIRYPKLLPEGKVWQSGVSLVDLMPTILEAAGVSIQSEEMHHGHSLISEIREDRDDWKRPVIIQNIPQAAIEGSFYEERTIREERFKLVLRKFINKPYLRPGELYDMKADPGEAKNLYEVPRFRSTIQELAQHMKSWGEETDDELAVELGAWAAGE